MALILKRVCEPHIGPDILLSTMNIARGSVLRCDEALLKGIVPTPDIGRLKSSSAAVPCGIFGVLSFCFNPSDALCREKTNDQILDARG